MRTMIGASSKHPIHSLVNTSVTMSLCEGIVSRMVRESKNTDTFMRKIKTLRYLNKAKAEKALTKIIADSGGLVLSYEVRDKDLPMIALLYVEKEYGFFPFFIYTYDDGSFRISCPNLRTTRHAVARLFFRLSLLSIPLHDIIYELVDMASTIHPDVMRCKFETQMLIPTDHGVGVVVRDPNTNSPVISTWIDEDKLGDNQKDIVSDLSTLDPRLESFFLARGASPTVADLLGHKESMRHRLHEIYKAVSGPIPYDRFIEHRTYYAKTCEFEFGSKFQEDLIKAVEKLNA